MDLQIQRTKQDYINLLNETIEYYKEHPRSATPKGECTYYNKKTGTKCAVGRCLNLDNYSENWEGKGVVMFDAAHGLENNLREKYRGYNIKFWQLLQGLHDSHSLWSNNILSEYGEDEKHEILNWIEENIS